MPTYDQRIHSEVMQNVLDFVLKAKEKNDDLSIQFPSSPFLTLSRNLIMQRGLDSDWILMWDSDIQVPTPEFFYKMVETAYKHEAALVGLLVRIKTYEINKPEFACGKKSEGGYMRLIKAPTIPEEVDVMGAGVTILNSRWIRDNLEQPYYEFKDVKGINGPAILPEDWCLCEKIKEKGGKIIVEPRIETIHYGNYGWHFML